MGRIAAALRQNVRHQERDCSNETERERLNTRPFFNCVSAAGQFALRQSCAKCRQFFASLSASPICPCAVPLSEFAFLLASLVEGLPSGGERCVPKYVADVLLGFN